jgi:hypothetical protein
MLFGAVPVGLTVRDLVTDADEKGSIIRRQRMKASDTDHLKGDLTK